MQSLREGTLLQEGKYRIVRVLGQGGFGITYLAEQVTLGRQVAIKEFFMRELCGRDAETSHVTLGTGAGRETVQRFREKFLKEARTISRLHHPSIISIYDVFLENGTAYYVMEYIEGESLNDLVERRGFLPVEEALSYIRSVGDALTYIHQRNINHLDVKPSNIMLRRVDKQIVLIDFGVAKQYDELTNEGTTTTPVGISPGYSPGEQYSKNGVQIFSPQSDVYALAATFFKLLTGLTPPEAISVSDMGVPINELKQRGVSESIIQAIVKAMKSRDFRPQTVAEFMGLLVLQDDENNEEHQSVDATIILENEDVPNYEVLSIHELEELADKKDVRAQFYLGKAYYNGKGVEQDYAEAAKWYRKAAEQGDSDAQLNLGNAYYNGKGVEQDYAEAVKWWRKAAEQGYASAQFKLGFAYSNGKGVEQDYAEAVKWWRKAAEQGNAYAQYNLGNAYSNGKGVEQDYAEAAKWYRKAAEQGHSDAQYNLGNAYYNGKGVVLNYSESRKWYRKAAEQGDADAQYCLGNAYWYGIGGTQDFWKAVKWWRKAAEQGDAGAQCKLGRAYYDGDCVEQDYAEAVKWYLKAAEQGDSQAVDELETYMERKGRFPVIISSFIASLLLTLLLFHGNMEYGWVEFVWTLVWLVLSVLLPSLLYSFYFASHYIKRNSSSLKFIGVGNLYYWGWLASIAAMVLRFFLALTGLWP